MMKTRVVNVDLRVARLLLLLGSILSRESVAFEETAGGCMLSNVRWKKVPTPWQDSCNFCYSINRYLFYFKKKSVAWRIDEVQCPPPPPPQGKNKNRSRQTVQAGLMWVEKERKSQKTVLRVFVLCRVEFSFLSMPAHVHVQVSTRGIPDDQKMLRRYNSHALRHEHFRAEYWYFGVFCQTTFSTNFRWNFFSQTNISPHHQTTPQFAPLRLGSGLNKKLIPKTVGNRKRDCA